MTIVLLLSLLLQSSGNSVYTSVRVDLDWNGEEKETEIAYRAVAGADGRFLRVSRDFDPEYMEVELLEASFGFPGSLRPVPEWAVDTLTGSTGWPLALVAAFPGLRPGMTMEWTWRVTENGPLAAAGFFYTYIAGNEPDTIIVSCPDLEGLISSATGFTMENRRGRRIYTSMNGDYRELWLSTAEEWSEVEDILLGPARQAALENPPDLREAAIEAGAAGALPRMRISRGRVLITESMQLQPYPGGDAGFLVRPVQEILDTRRATPMEAATLLSAMCRIMGIEAPVVPATDILPPVPSPLGFHRVFILAEGLLEEPSEYLSPAGWVDTRDTLWLLLPGGCLAELPPEPESDHCRESWEIHPETGEFSLHLSTAGGFDRELRRKLAGLGTTEVLLVVSDWFRSSGIWFIPRSVSTSDFYDLAEDAELHVAGEFLEYAGTWVETVPSLNWNRTGTIERSYGEAEVRNGLIIP